MAEQSGEKEIVLNNADDNAFTGEESVSPADFGAMTSRFRILIKEMSDAEDQLGISFGANKDFALRTLEKLHDLHEEARKFEVVKLFQGEARSVVEVTPETEDLLRRTMAVHKEFSILQRFVTKKKTEKHDHDALIKAQNNANQMHGNKE